MPHAGLLQSFGEHRSDILRFLRARTGSADDAEDLAADLFVKLQTLDPTGPIANPRSYLLAMANNLVLDRLRENRRRQLRERRWTEEQVGPEGEPAIDRGDTPEMAALEADEARRLRQAIETLPPGARRVLVMHKLEGRAHGEIASTLGISRSAVEKHMAVAMTHLRRALGQLR
jgi:RNA polymerase sigma-70 factor (ECF subfamily)